MDNKKIQLAAEYRNKETYFFYNGSYMFSVKGKVNKTLKNLLEEAFAGGMSNGFRLSRDAIFFLDETNK